MGNRDIVYGSSAEGLYECIVIVCRHVCFDVPNGLAYHDQPNPIDL